MTIELPRIVALDSSTLGVIARDFWSDKAVERNKAEHFIAELKARGVYLAFTITHIAELLRHENLTVAQNRLRFLNQLPMIAWVRPYGGEWFVGSLVDLLLREVTAFQKSQLRDWRSIIEDVRPKLWESGTGAEMFVNNPNIWTPFRSDAQQQHVEQRYVASIARSQTGRHSKMTVAESRKSPKRSQNELRNHFRQFATEVNQALKRHGDRRLGQSAEIAVEFAQQTLRRVESFDMSNGDFVDQIITRAGIPQEVVTSSTTVEEIGELAIYAKQLELFGELLKPSCRLSMVQMRIDALPRTC